MDFSFKILDPNETLSKFLPQSLDKAELADQTGNNVLEDTKKQHSSQLSGHIEEQKLNSQDLECSNEEEMCLDQFSDLLKHVLRLKIEELKKVDTNIAGTSTSAIEVQLDQSGLNSKDEQSFHIDCNRDRSVGADSSVIHLNKMELTQQVDPSDLQKTKKEHSVNLSNNQPEDNKDSTDETKKEDDLKEFVKGFSGWISLYILPKIKKGASLSEHKNEDSQLEAQDQYLYKQKFELIGRRKGDESVSSDQQISEEQEANRVTGLSQGPREDNCKTQSDLIERNKSFDSGIIGEFRHVLGNYYLKADQSRILLNQLEHDKENAKYPLSLREKALNENPDNPVGNFNYGVALLQQNKPDAAIYHLTKAIDQDVKSFAPYLFLCLAYTWQKRFVEAVQMLRKATQINSNILNKLSVLVLVLALNEQPVGIIYHLWSSIENGVLSWSGSAHYIWGSTLEQKSAYEDAVVMFRAGLKKDPDYFMYYLPLSMALLALDQYDEVIEIAQKIVVSFKWNKGVAYGYYMLGRALSRKGEYAKTLSCYQNVIKFDPDFIDGYLCLAKVLALKRQYKKAIRVAKRAQKIDNNNAEAHQIIAIALMSQGTLSNDKDLVAQVLEKDPESQITLLLKGVMLTNQISKESKDYLCEQLGYINPANEMGSEESDENFDDFLDSLEDFTASNENNLSGLTGLEEQQTERSLSSLGDTRPDSYVFRILLGEIYAEEGNLDAARKETEKAFRNKEKTGLYYNSLGSQLERQGKWHEAAVNFEKASSLEPKNEDIYIRWANVLLEQDRLVEAKSKLDKAIQINPNKWEAYFYYCKVLFKEDDYEGTILYFEKADHLKPQDEGVYISWANMLFNLRRYGEAKLKLKQALQININSWKAYFNYADILMREDQHKAAISYLKRANKLNPENEDIYTLWGEALLGESQWAEAKLKFERAIQISPSKWKAYYHYGRTLMQEESYADAATYFQKANSLQPGNDDINLFWGWAFLEQHKLAEAKSKFEEVIRINPNKFQAYVDYGAILGTEGNYEAAVTQFERANNLQPVDEDTCVLWAVALLQLGQYANAKSKLERALQINPKSEEARNYYYHILTLKDKF